MRLSTLFTRTWKRFPPFPFRCSSTCPPNLTLKYRDDIAVITMDGGRNKISTDWLKELNQLLDQVERNEDCLGLVTRGEGKYYSTGLDMDELRGISTKEVVQFVKDANITMRRILMFPVPTMAAMNGHAYAEGAILAFCHDLRIMNKDKGWICFNEVLNQIPFNPYYLSFLGPKLGGGKNLSDAVVLARRYSGPEAVDNRIVHGVVPAHAVHGHSERVLRSFLGRGLTRNSLSQLKRQVYANSENVFKKMLEDNFLKRSKVFMSEEQKMELDNLDL